ALAILEDELARISLKLNLDKSAAYIPERSVNGLGTDPAITKLKQVEGGLPALGSAFGGEFETELGVYSVAAQPALRRLASARHLAKECARFRGEGREEASWQAAWHVLHRVASKALVYDVRTLEPEVSLPLAEELDAVINDSARALLGVQADDGWTNDTSMQLHWPSVLGGMGFGSATLGARLGRLAALGQCLPVARQHLRALLPDAAEEDILNAIPLDGAERMLDWLKETHGIELSVSGTIARESEPRWNLRARFDPIRGLYSTVSKVAQEAQRADMLARHSAAEQASQREGANAARRDPAESERLKSKEATMCGKPCDRLGDHAQLCGVGRGRYRVHNAVAACLRRFAMQSGVEAETEEVCPPLLQGEPGAEDAVEARLDVHLWGHGPELHEDWVDATVTNPFRLERRRQAAQEDAHGALTAEKAKFKRYGEGRGGVAVSPVGLEAWGRFGPHALAVLEKLALQRSSRGGGPPARCLQRWRAEIGAATIRALAETASSATRERE
ncbi:unnamed protein product, partial [Prorocentrum cordatum]